MRTLGIDLASQPARTAACLIEWKGLSATVLRLEFGVTDQRILEIADQLDFRPSGGDMSDAIGIDAPFGWPQPFVEFISRRPTGKRDVSGWTPRERVRLSYRLTDLYVQQVTGLWPLAVTADKIALPTMRCSGLLDDLGVIDRSGADRVFEVYPAAALKAWGFPFRGYKSDDSESVLSNLVDQVRETCRWLTFASEADAQRLNHHDTFDALIAALVCRTAAMGRTVCPIDAIVVDNDGQPVLGSAVVQRAGIEGWIMLPGKEWKLGDIAGGVRAQPDGERKTRWGFPGSRDDSV